MQTDRQKEKETIKSAKREVNEQIQNFQPQDDNVKKIKRHAAYRLPVKQSVWHCFLLPIDLCNLKSSVLCSSSSLSLSLEKRVSGKGSSDSEILPENFLGKVGDSTELRAYGPDACFDS